MGPRLESFKRDLNVDREVFVVWLCATALYTILCAPRLNRHVAAWLERKMPKHPLNRAWNSLVHAALACLGATLILSQWTRADWVCGLVIDSEMVADTCFSLGRPVARLSRLFMAHEAGYFVSDSVFMESHNRAAFLPHHMLALFCIGSVSTDYGVIGLLPATMLFLPIELGSLSYHVDRALFGTKTRSMYFVVTFTVTRLSFCVGVVQIMRFVLRHVMYEYAWTTRAYCSGAIAIAVAVLLIQNMLWLRVQLLAARAHHNGVQKQA